MQPPPKLALVEWNHLIEDYLGNIGLTMDDYTQRMTGGWLFGYIEALKTANVQTVLFCFSAKVEKPTELLHQPTGATICVLPATGLYRRIRKKILNPYTANVNEAAADATGWKRYWYSFLLNIAPYAATPLTELFRQIKRYGCTAVLCQDYEHPRFDLCVLAAKRRGLPVFATFQGGNWQLGKMEKWLRPTALKRSDGLIVASGAEVKRLKETYGIAEKKIARIFNPVSPPAPLCRCEARKALGLPENLRIAAWHGRVDYYRKGLDVLLDAWEKVCAELSEEKTMLILLGNGVNAGLLRLRLKQTRLRNIRWTEEYTNDRQRINMHLKAADVYLFPSRNEGFPVAPLEAMACGLPLIAAGAPGISDILQEGEESGGMMVPQENATALAAATVDLFRNDEKRQRLGSLAARNIEQNFSPQAVGRQLRQFLFHGQ